MDFLDWIADPGNSKQVALVLFFGVFVGIVLYVYTGKRRTRRLESYKHIPFDDETEETRDRREAKRDDDRA
ncbi:MAG: cbb3-type cytochrome c oxidase subunit 3 [Gammaproteobacteria bacterium]|nr:cbb3-type cytochrome c oxidase subunit 3 [Gammaproteobacteria bacterium]